MRLLAILAVAAVCGGCAMDDDAALPVRTDVETPVACLVTVTAAKLCDEDAVAWCQAISEHGLTGRGTDNVRDVWRISDPMTRDACMSVGWSGS